MQQRRAVHVLPDILPPAKQGAICFEFQAHASHHCLNLAKPGARLSRSDIRLQCERQSVMSVIPVQLHVPAVAVAGCLPCSRCPFRNPRHRRQNSNSNSWNTDIRAMTPTTQIGRPAYVPRLVYPSLFRISDVHDFRSPRCSRCCRCQPVPVTLYFLWVSDPAPWIARVSARVRRGDHGIPEHEIRRHYSSGLGKVHSFFAERVTEWHGANAVPSNGSTLRYETHGGRDVALYVGNASA